MNSEQKSALLFVLKHIALYSPNFAMRIEASEHLRNVAAPLPVSKPERGTAGFGSTDQGAPQKMVEGTKP